MLYRIEDKSELFIYLYQEDDVYIYGAGQMAKLLLPIIIEIAPSRLTGILINKNQTNNLDALNTNYNILDATNPVIKKDAFIIIATNANYWSDIISYLKHNGYNKFAVLSDNFINMLNQNLLNVWAYRPRLKLSFEVHLVEHCNLNCYSCHHFSPLAEPEFLSVEEYEKDCQRLSSLFGGVCQNIHLLGGEPLLHPKIMDFLSVTRKNFPLGNISIITNGILLPQMSSKFWKTCKEEKIEIMYTKYPIKVDYEVIQKNAKLYGVKCLRYNNINPKKMLNRFPLKTQSDNGDIAFKMCSLGNRCIELSHGKMYTCPFPAYARHLIKYFHLESKIHISSRDGIDIYSVKDGNELMERLSKPIPFCSYCDNTLNEYGIPFKISERKIDEWCDESCYKK